MVLGSYWLYDREKKSVNVRIHGGVWELLGVFCPRERARICNSALLEVLDMHLKMLASRNNPPSDSLLSLIDKCGARARYEYWAKGFVEGSSAVQPPRQDKSVVLNDPADDHVFRGDDEEEEGW